MLPPHPPERLTLPGWTPPATRSGFPLVATLAPVVVSVVLWVVTQSVYTLLFAVLGPVVAVGGLIDARVQRRRATRRELARCTAALERSTALLLQLQGNERERLARLSLDSRELPDWSAGDGPVPVRIGTGTITGTVEVHGDDVDEAPDVVTAAVRNLRTAASLLHDAPIVVDARDGIGISGPTVVAAAIARSIALRLATRLSPVDAVLTAPPGEPWTHGIPHALDEGAPFRYVWRDGAGEIRLAWGERESDLPLGCGILLSIGDGTGVVTGPAVPAHVRSVLPEACSAAEAVDVAAALKTHAASRGLRPTGSQLPARAPFAELIGNDGKDAQPHRRLIAAIGMGAEGPVTVDLGVDGPHAVIAGTTGSGKSELLISWILGLAAGGTPDDVVFLLVDFKGGSAFAPLAALPHVLATLSDLDARATARAIESLRAEMLHRERILADAGARAIDDLDRGALPHLVIVVDEYAAVVTSSPGLHEVFGDIAARGRSLGLHLILCTQRPAGVIRDAVLANVTLRISLRVTDRGDSIAMLGSDAAARLPAEPRGRGIVVTGDGPKSVQLAIADHSDIAAIVSTSARSSPRRTWCEPLPVNLSLAAVPPAPDGLVFGLVDLPAEQRQPPAVHDPDRHGHLLVLGASGSGLTTTLSTIAVSAVQNGMTLRVVPRTPADAWAVIAAEAASAPATARTMVVIDDLDALVAGFDADMRPEFVELLGSLARGVTGTRPAIAAAARRITSSIAALTSLFGSRIVLRQVTRDDHVLAGGDPGGFDPELPAGAGSWRGTAVQVAQPSDVDRTILDAAVPELPRVVIAGDSEPRVVAIVAARPRALIPALAATGARVVELGAAPVPEPADLQVIESAAAAVLLGDPDAWLNAWTLLTAARRDWPIVLIGLTAADYRAVLRDREPPPPLGSAPGECWLSVDGRTVRALLEIAEPAQESVDIRPRNG